MKLAEASLRLLCLLAVCGTAAADGAPVTVDITSQGWHFAASAPSTQQALEADWGQFEIRLPVKGFPLPAPNCRDEIRLRWVAIPPKQADRAAALQRRWELLQRLKTLREHGDSAAPETVRLDTVHYVQRASNGQLQLKYCNAFAVDNAAVAP
ncbi:hypothetical protein ACG04R_02110 [Roseateles sp. BYS78W]|uniref:Uncharacterized protein n=1 Tax=Pelomonas candidula TaxID=3299025 RepID=A0ABW7H6R3_9BURK